MLDLISEFPVLHILLRILVRRFYDEPCLLFSLRCSCVRRAVDRNGVELASYQMIDLVIVGDLEDLATELVVRFVRGDGVERTDESLLCQVLGESPVTDHAIDQGEDGPLITAKQLGESTFVSGR